MKSKKFEGKKRIFIATVLIILVATAIFSNSLNLESNLLFSLIGAVSGSLFGPVGIVAGAITGYGASEIKEVYACEFICITIVVTAAIYGANKGANANANQCSVYVPPNEGYDCTSCNDNPLIPCTEYSCRAIGQRCAPRLDDEGKVVCYETTREYTPPSVIGCVALTLDNNLDLQGENFVEFYDLDGELDEERSGANAAKSRVTRR